MLEPHGPARPELGSNPNPVEKANPSLWLLFSEFFKLGATSWGGFALMSASHRAFVERRALIRPQDYSDAIALAWTIPGPVAGNVVAQLGHRMRGMPGAVVCGIGAVLPFFLVLIVLSASYAAVARNGTLISAVIAGFIPAVCATIALSAVAQAREIVRSLMDAIILLAAAVALLALKGSFAPLLVMAAAGVIGCFAYRKTPMPTIEPPRKAMTRGLLGAVLLMLLCLGLYLFPHLLPAHNGPLKLLAAFAGISLTLFGGGLVVIPVLQHLVVNEMQWVDANGFAAAIAASQMSPGPILSSATFIGYQVAGIPGALAATVGIFGPPAVLMIICSGFADRLSRLPVFARAMRGVRAAVTGLVFVSLITIAANGKAHPASFAIFAATLFAQVLLRVPPALLLPVAGLAGWFAFMPTVS